jgi:hypothetical protein
MSTFQLLGRSPALFAGICLLLGLLMGSFGSGATCGAG